MSRNKATRDALSQSRLKELLEYNPETGIFLRCSSVGGRLNGSIAGCVNMFGYRLIAIDKQYHQEHRLAWLYVHGRWPSGEIDHINRVKADNRICNLRDATRGINNQNKAMQTNNTSGHAGIYQVRNRWRAIIQAGGVRRNLGYFASSEQASAAYVLARNELHVFASDEELENVR